MIKARTRSGRYLLHDNPVTQPSLSNGKVKQVSFCFRSGHEAHGLSLFTTPQEQKHPNMPRPRLFTVGRLDVATTGLLIVTNDGDYAQAIAHPSSGVTKE